MPQEILNEWVRCEGCFELNNIDSELAEKNNQTIEKNNYQKDLKFYFCEPSRISQEIIKISSSDSSCSIKTSSSFENSPNNQFAYLSMGVSQITSQSVQKTHLKNTIPYKKRKEDQQTCHVIKEYTNPSINQVIRQDNNNNIHKHKQRHYQTIHQHRLDNYLQQFLSELPFGVKLYLGENLIRQDLEKLRNCVKEEELHQKNEINQQEKEMKDSQIRNNDIIDTMHLDCQDDYGDLGQRNSSKIKDKRGRLNAGDKFKDRNSINDMVMQIGGYEDNNCRLFKINKPMQQIGCENQKNRRQQRCQDDDNLRLQPSESFITTRSKNSINCTRNTLKKQNILK